VAAARRLLTSALERGAATEETFALLDRLSRLEAAGAHQLAPAGAAAVVPADREPAAVRERRSRLVWIAAGALFGVIAGAFAIAVVWTNGEAWIGNRPTPETLPVAAVALEPLPVPAPAEVWIARARGMFEKGRLREALTALDEIRDGDPLAAQADELRATIQERLLESARDAAAPSGTPGPVEPSR
jgi:hypothetical protein